MVVDLALELCFVFVFDVEALDLGFDARFELVFVAPALDLAALAAVGDFLVARF